jgi:hypothetical protein
MVSLNAHAKFNHPIMKKIIFTLWMFFSAQILPGQNASDCPRTMVVQNHRHHFLYPGANYLSISIPGILIDTCTISLLGPATIESSNCSDIYFFIHLKPIVDPENPAEEPEVWIEVKDAQGNILAKQKFVIVDFPAPIAFLDGKFSGRVPLEASKFKECSFLKTNMDHLLTGYCSDCKVLSFTVIQVGKDGKSMVLQNIGPYFNAGVKSLIQKAAPGDMFLFTEITSECGVGIIKEKISNALVFKIY